MHSQYPQTERSITDRLADLGICHDRDEWSDRDSCHRLYWRGAFIGRYDAGQAVAVFLSPIP